jgi:uncharacterized damage-inducible protein DinB
MNTEQVVALAHYNQWMNEKVYTAAARLEDEERKRDRGAFFSSIHRTLNHLLVGDQIWIARFTGTTSTIRRLDEELYGEFDALRAERVRFDQKIVDWAVQLTEADLERELVFTGITNPGRRRCSMWFAVTHLFNHQTHHRGQLSTLLFQAGQDVGTTDLISLPGQVERMD